MSSKDTNNSLFHFCSVNDYLMDNLKKGGLSFAALEKLNDPIEEQFYVLFPCNNKDFWKEMFVNYARSLFFAYSGILSNRTAEFILEEPFIPQGKLDYDIKNPFEKDFLSLCKVSPFLSFVDNISDDLNLLNNKKITLVHLEYIFSFISGFLLDLFQSYYVSIDVNPFPKNDYLQRIKESTNKKEPEEIKEYIVNCIKEFISSNPDSNDDLLNYAIYRDVVKDLHINVLINKEKAEIYSKCFSKNIIFLRKDFSSKYCAKLKSLMFPKAFSLSFTRYYANPVMWSHYGDNHCGVCLELDKNKFEECLSPSKTKLTDGRLCDVNYVDKIPNFDFISNLYNLHDVIKTKLWKKTSKLIDKDKKTDSSFVARSFKQLDWINEAETRALLLADYMNPYRHDERYFLKYGESLKAIYFGVRCERNKMIAVAQKISNTNVKFYKIFIDPKNESLKKYELHFDNKKSAFTLIK